MLSNNRNILTGTMVDNALTNTPHKQEHYLGVVRERFEDNTDDSEEKPRNYKIKFDILGLPGFTDNYPTAVLLGNSTRPVNKDDIVKIWDICDISTGTHTFFYEPVFEDRFTGIKNYDNEINLTEKNYVKMKLPNTEIIFDKSGGQEQSQDDVQDNTKGKLSISSGGSTVEIDAATGAISISAKSGSTISINGNQMGFNCIANCPYTGLPHVQNKIPTL